MYDSLTRPHIALVRKALAAVGADFPKPVQKALAEQDKIQRAAREYSPATVDQILAAVADCLLADRDPANDEQVRRMVTSQSLVSGSGALNISAAAERRVVVALTEHVDAVLATLAPHVEEAGRALAAAQELIGDETDPTQIMRMGPAAVEAFASAERASSLLSTIDNAWSALASLTGFASNSSEPVLRLASLDLATFERTGRKATPREIVRAGGVISLANRTTYAERVRRIVEDREDRVTGAAEAQRDWVRRHHGMGVAL